MIADFRREVDGNWVLLGCYAARSGKFLTGVSGQPVGTIFKGQESKKAVLLGFLTLQDGEDRLFRNDSKELPLLAA